MAYDISPQVEEMPRRTRSPILTFLCQSATHRVLFCTVSIFLHGHWNNIAKSIAVFLLHLGYGEQYLAQIIRFYKENPFHLICKAFVWLSQLHDTEEG